MCQVHFNRQGDLLTVSLEGEFILGCTGEIKEQVQRYAEEANLYRWIVDLQGVSFMDSSGLGTLVAWYKLVNQHHGQIVFCNLASHVHKIVSLAKLDKLLTVCDSLDAAKAQL